ncbi:membrane protein insertase YidC [Desulfopila sp. IMCC35008]|uniref:membrane protein insertase YidC n=1 Tax=Desulfopila sp. IMCC35008 TaxID=2653858 RepID=UPI0013D83FA7|nr:membrane protein insertase YidC [Desulfopila sp. IMCC35008]
MDTYRAFLAVIISFVILLGYQYFFVGFGPKEQPVGTAEVSGEQQPIQTASQPAAQPSVVAPAPAVQAPAQQVVVNPDARDIQVETDLFTAVVSENGGVLKSMRLKNYREENGADSPGMDLVNSDDTKGFPLNFSWGSAVPQGLYFKSETGTVEFREGKGNLTMVADAGNGLKVVRTYTFLKDSYLVGLNVAVQNMSEQPLQGTPQIYQVNTPFSKTGSPADRFLFRGPSSYINGELNEIKAKDLEDGPQTLQGAIEWAGYGGNYFIRAIVPLENAATSYSMEGTEDLTRTMLAGSLDTLQPGTEKTYQYQILYGPKKVTMLRDAGYNLERSVNFGWFDVIARPTLWLLNFFYSYVGNYGIAIILVTCMFKALFWPITQKGMKSMRNMQKLQPKMVKIKEKYKDDPTKMNQEVMGLYKTYKVNPLGGCLPMVLQIPVFFALYKVLLQSIELRHAPFMLWINDLSAPDRLWIGIDIPYLGGIPVLTLMMGASMWLQQKMTPTTADPAQAKILQFLPVIFTFMFLNFASGLVLYWFINNLLSILQQQLINRDVKVKPAKA